MFINRNDASIVSASASRVCSDLLTSTSLNHILTIFHTTRNHVDLLFTDRLVPELLGSIRQPACEGALGMLAPLHAEGGGCFVDSLFSSSIGQVQLAQACRSTCYRSIVRAASACESSEPEQIGRLLLACQHQVSPHFRLWPIFCALRETHQEHSLLFLVQKLIWRRARLGLDRTAFRSTSGLRAPWIQAAVVTGCSRPCALSIARVAAAGNLERKRPWRDLHCEGGQDT